MFGDIKRFMVLLGIVMFAFGLAFSGLISAQALIVPTETAVSCDAAPSEGTDECIRAAEAEAESDLWQRTAATSSSFVLAFWAIHGDNLGHEPLAQPRLVALLLWVYFMLSQVVLLNLLVAIMGDTWQQISQHADDEWKMLKVQAIEEYFELHHIPPPFNAPQLVYALLANEDLHERTGPLPRCTVQRSAIDIQKKSKQAQLDLLRHLRLEEEATTDVQLRTMHRSQRECVDRLERVAAMVALSNAAKLPHSPAAPFHPGRPRRSQSIAGVGGSTASLLPHGLSGRRSDGSTASLLPHGLSGRRSDGSTASLLPHGSPSGWLRRGQSFS